MSESTRARIDCKSYPQPRSAFGTLEASEDQRPEETKKVRRVEWVLDYTPIVASDSLAPFNPAHMDNIRRMAREVTEYLNRELFWTTPHISVQHVVGNPVRLKRPKSWFLQSTEQGRRFIQQRVNDHQYAASMLNEYDDPALDGGRARWIGNLLAEVGRESFTRMGGETLVLQDDLPGLYYRRLVHSVLLCDFSTATGDKALAIEAIAMLSPDVTIPILAPHATGAWAHEILHTFGLGHPDEENPPICYGPNRPAGCLGSIARDAAGGEIDIMTGGMYIPGVAKTRINQPHLDKLATLHPITYWSSFVKFTITFYNAVTRRLPDGDRLQIERTTTSGLPSNHIAVHLERGGSVTWWKAITLVHRTTGQRRELVSVDKSDGGKEVSFDRSLLLENDFVLSKGKGITGAHTDMYCIADAYFAMKPGMMTRFRWIED